MAITYRSASNAQSYPSNPITIALPAGTQAGDLLILIIYGYDCDGLTTPSGFTVYNTEFTDEYDMVCYYKIATAGDVSAGSYTIQHNGANGGRTAGMLAFSGITSEYYFASSSTTGKNNVSPYSYSYAISIGTPIENVLMIMATGARDTAGDCDITNHAITNQNPTWNLVVEKSSNNSEEELKILYAIQTRTSDSTGNITATGTSALDQITAMISCFTPIKTQTFTDTLTITDTNIGDTNGIFIDIASTTDTLIGEKGRVWNKTSKPTTTWTKINK